MIPVKFEEANIVYGKKQPDYIPLPGHISADGNAATFCFELTDEEIKTLVETKQIWLSLLTFGKPLQPIRLSTIKSELL